MAVAQKIGAKHYLERRVKGFVKSSSMPHAQPSLRIRGRRISTNASYCKYSFKCIQNDDMRWGGSTPRHHVIISILMCQGGSTPPWCVRFDPVRRRGSTLPLRVAHFNETLLLFRREEGRSSSHRYHFNMARRVYPSCIAIPVSTQWGGSAPPFCVVIQWSEGVYPSSSCHYSISRWGRLLHPNIYIKLCI